MSGEDVIEWNMDEDKQAGKMSERRVPEESSDNMSAAAHPTSMEKLIGSLDKRNMDDARPYERSEKPQWWTENAVVFLMAHGGAKAIAAAHNDALAAANRKYKPQVLQDSEARVEELEAQLAAERAAYDKGYEDCRKLWKQELAAERGKYPTHCPNCGWPGTTEASRQ
jgi:hypothetical protein